MGTDAGIPFGNYTLLKRIARGGMAEVFVARQEGMDGFDRMVAIKRILPHLLDDQSFVRMFQDEARLAARLSHPNVIHIYDFGKVDEHFFIAMELMHAVHAGDLIRLATEKKMPPALVARIGANACAGLHYAHNRKDNLGNPLKLVHRDVSPPNLLISYDGVVKLVDFGIAKAVSSIEQTRPGVVKGKYAFMSPEQTMGQSLDGHSDVFSLALVLWEMLAGQSAVTRDDQILAMQTIRDGKVPSINSVRKDVPSKLAAALHNALQKSPEKRSDARQFGKELEAFIKGSKEIATNIELGAWLTEHLPPKPVLLGDESPQGTKLATAATGLRVLDDNGHAGMLFEDHPASKEDDADEEEDDDEDGDAALVTKLIKSAEVADLPSVKGKLTQHHPSPTPRPEEDADSVVIARDLISQEAREVGRPTPTTSAYPSASNEGDLDAAKVGHPTAETRSYPSASNEDSLEDSSSHEDSSAVEDFTDADPLSQDSPAAMVEAETDADTKDAPTVVGHGFTTKATGLEEMDEPTNDLAGPTEVDDLDEAATVEDQQAIGAGLLGAAHNYESVAPITGKMLAAGTIQGSRPGLARYAPWAAAGIALIALLIIAGGDDEGHKAKPAVDPNGQQPIVFDQAEADAYRRDAGGLPPILVTPLPDGGMTQAPPVEVPETDLPEPEKEPAPRKRLGKNMGQLQVQTTPESDVYYRSEKLGSTPLSDLALKAGRYRLKFVADGGAAETRSVVIRAGKVTKLDFAFQR